MCWELSKKKKLCYVEKTVGKAVQTWFCAIKEVFVQDKRLKGQKRTGEFFFCWVVNVWGELEGERARGGKFSKVWWTQDRGHAHVELSNDELPFWDVSHPKFSRFLSVVMDYRFEQGAATKPARSAYKCWHNNYLSSWLPFPGHLTYYRDKLMAVPTARVARMLAPLTFSTGLQLAGGLAPKPPFRPIEI